MSHHLYSLSFQTKIRLVFALCKHGRFHLVRIENKHAAPSSTARDKSTLFFDEGTALVKSNLHPLLNNLADRDQVRRDGGYMQYIFNICLDTFFAERNIAYVWNQMPRSVISGFDIAGSLRLSKFAKPLLVGCHMV